MADLYNPSYLQQLCQQYRLKPSKKYGQNFLIQPEPIQQMIKAAELSRRDAVVEVGPGFGVLTLPLVEQAKRVIAYEIEKKLKKYWDDILPSIPAGKLEIVWGNVLNAPRLPSVVSYKVVASLPYQITSSVIRKFLEADQPPELMVLMAQAEVAERICAQSGQMSLLAVAVQYYALPEIIAKAPRTYFWPSPQVDSAVIRLKVNKDRKAKAISQKFFQIVKAGFANRRKLLINNLINFVGKDKKAKMKRIFKQVGLNEQARAQELSVGQWVELSAII